MKSYTNDFAGDDYEQFIQSAIDFGLEITFRKGPNTGYPEFTVSGEENDINDWRAVTGFDDGLPLDESVIQESGVARYSVGGKSSSGGNTALGVVGHGDFRDFGASNLDFFGEHLIDEIKNNLAEIKCRIGSREKLAINLDRTEITMDKDPEPGKTVKQRKIRAHVYFNSKFANILEDRALLKQRVLTAFQNGKADFNDKFGKDFLIPNELKNISKSFKYSTDGESMYFVFKATEEAYKGEKSKAIIVHKHAKESKSISEAVLEESHIQGTCPICGDPIWSDEGVSLNVNGDWCHSYCLEE